MASPGPPWIRRWLPTKNPDFSCENFLNFLHRTEISAILAYFLFKFGCHGNSLGSLKNSDSVLKFTSPEIPTVHAISFPIFCRELMSAIFWPKFGCHGNHYDSNEILYTIFKFADPENLLVMCRVATHLENLENLEKSGNSKVVREKSGKMEKVREKSGKHLLSWTLNKLKS